MRTRKILVNVLRVAVSAALIWVAVRMIDVKDRFVVRLASGAEVEAESVEERPEEVVGRLAGGSEQRWPRAEVKEVRRREGLLSLWARADRAWAIVLTPLLLVPIVTLSWRWWTLLRANAFAVPFGRVFVLTYMGLFFNQFLPGAVGGDLARMYLTARDEQRKAAAATTVLLDRVVGLATMIVVAALAVIPLAGDERLRVPVITVLSLFGAMALGWAAYVSPLGRAVKRRLPFQPVVVEIDGVLRDATTRPRLMAATCAQSFVGQAAAVLIAYGFAHALGLRVPLAAFFLFEVIIFILAAVPVSVGGWGVQEVAYAQLFATVGVPANEAVALSILLRLAVLAVSLPAGALFALGWHRSPPADNVAA